jgi:hypothetical protein
LKALCPVSSLQMIQTQKQLTVSHPFNGRH